MKKRWNPYVLLHNDTVSQLWKEHFSSEKEKVLFILGKGFDTRMNMGISSLLTNCPDINLDCVLISFDEGKSSNSHEYSDMVKQNMIELKSILSGKNIQNKSIKLWNTKGRKRRRIGDREAGNLFVNFEDIQEFTDIIVDISALPRGIYFSLVGKLLSLIDEYCKDFSKNLFLCVAENASIDNSIQENSIDEDLSYLYGFGGEIDLEVSTPRSTCFLRMI